MWASGCKLQVYKVFQDTRTRIRTTCRGFQPTQNGGYTSSTTLQNTDSHSVCIGDGGKRFCETRTQDLFGIIIRKSCANWSNLALRQCHQIKQDLTSAGQPHAVSNVPFGMTTKGCTGLGETSAQLSKLCCAGCAFLPWVACKNHSQASEECQIPACKLDSIVTVCTARHWKGDNPILPSCILKL